MSKKNVFLTGSSAGIGLATARLLTEKGYKVWGTSRSDKQAHRHPLFHPVQMDLNNPSSIEEGFTQAMREAGAFQVLINNAGSGIFGSFMDVPPEGWQQMMQTLCFGPMHLIRTALPQLRTQGDATIINVTSLAVRFPIPFMGPYNTGKAAFSAFTQSLRMELHRSPVRVTELQPGDINTPFHDAMPIAQRFDEDTSTPARENAFRAIEKNMRDAPSPDIVARKIIALIRTNNPPPVVTVGDVFQSRLAPLGERILPSRVLERVMREFYSLDRPAPAKSGA